MLSFVVEIWFWVKTARHEKHAFNLWHSPFNEHRIKNKQLTLPMRGELIGLFPHYANKQATITKLLL